MAQSNRAEDDFPRRRNHHGFMSPNLTEILRLIENLICYGTVVAADYPSARVKVSIKGRATAWLPWSTDRAAHDRSWDAPEIGEQVLVLCPSGDPANGVIAGTLFRQAAPAPASSVDTTRRVFGDGMVIEHDRATKLTRINALDSEGTLVLEAKNIVLRTGEEGYFHLDHHGKATRLTHLSGPNFESESWINGSVVTAKPDYGYQPPEVLTPDEEDAGL
ncbi:phage baseplate assembly protein V [Kiloniella laminariae]|uniref:Phage baseplate assembly protein V n=1 Tax=Kiloniella laminariae TaxID=454162 RepID=A0ABT4LKS3_9PROT|nr:phage baseplate assembly protein V [Kiloniella laminariae]MCZ4281703.1 phage baseplate assembly protein V [Kiloniella laminariae]